MEVLSAIKIEGKRILTISGAVSAAIALLAVLMRFNPASIAGVFTGYATGGINFILLARTVKNIGTGGHTAVQAKRIMKRSYAARMLVMAAVSVVSISVIGVNPLSHALLMPLQGIVARFGRAKR